MAGSKPSGSRSISSLNMTAKSSSSSQSILLPIADRQVCVRGHRPELSRRSRYAWFFPRPTKLSLDYVLLVLFL